MPDVFDRRRRRRRHRGRARLWRRGVLRLALLRGAAPSLLLWRSAPGTLLRHACGHLHAQPGAKAHAHGLVHRATLAHGLGRFPLHVIVEVACDAAACARIERFLHLWRQRNVFDVQLGDRQTVALDDRIDGLGDQAAHLAGVGGHVQHGNAAGRDGAAEFLHHDVADLKADLVRGEFAVGAHNLGQELCGVHDLDRVAPKGPDAGGPEFGIPQHDRVLCAPLQVREPAGVDKVDLGHEGRFEPVVPVLQRGHDRHVVRFEHVQPGCEHIGQLSFVHEDGGLPFAHCQLGAVLDFMAFTLEAPDHGVAGVIRPVDDVDELPRQKVPDAHGASPLRRLSLEVKIARGRARGEPCVRPPHCHSGGLGRRCVGRIDHRFCGDGV